MKKIITISLFAFLINGYSVFSQNRNLYMKNAMATFSYQVGLLAADSNSDSDYSYLGWDLEYKTRVTPSFALGGHIGYQGFYMEYPEQTYEFDQAQITSKLLKYYHIIPLQVAATWLVRTSFFVQPYLGVNVGANYILTQGDIGYYTTNENAVNLSVAPEAGVIIPLGKNSKMNVMKNRGKYDYDTYKKNNTKVVLRKYSLWALNIRGKYNYCFYNESNDPMIAYDFNELAYWNVMIGLSYTW